MANRKYYPSIIIKGMSIDSLLKSGDFKIVEDLNDGRGRLEYLRSKPLLGKYFITTSSVNHILNMREVDLWVHNVHQEDFWNLWDELLGIFHGSAQEISVFR